MKLTKAKLKEMIREELETITDNKDPTKQPTFWSKFIKSLTGPERDEEGHAAAVAADEAAAEEINKIPRRRITARPKRKN
tara:strand:+ start:509 stop:748 length:240 start_codon:yes stop_codon:yes gene_type:complete